MGNEEIGRNVKDKIEFGIRTCSHLVLDMEERSWIDTPNELEFDITEVSRLTYSGVTCNLTNQPCALFQRHYDSFYIDFEDMPKCPVFDSATKKYSVEGGIVPGNRIRVEKLEEIQ